MNVIILKPRLDTPFGHHGPVPETRGPIEPIRTHWANFVEKKYVDHMACLDSVFVIEDPLWRFTVEYVSNIVRDTKVILYVPHKEDHSFSLPDNPNAMIRYYHQSVFPWIFYDDSKGFAGGSTLYPFDQSKGNPDGIAFDELRAYALRGGTKFEQPASRGVVDGAGDFVLFPCQLPHDQTIKYHSSVSSEQALEETCRATQKLGLTLIVKGHPINPGSMTTQRNICDKYKHTIWVDNVNILDLIPAARAVVVVNSGTGMESLLHLRPVITFGRCEYDCVTMKADLSGNIEGFLKDPQYNEIEVRKFFDLWTKRTYNTRRETN